MEDFDGEELHRAQKRRLLVQELNPCIICSLCDGYLIDATAINECLHTFCRSCIVRYLESSRYCPTCEILIHKNKPLSALRADKSLQLLVYKLIPSVYQNEVKRRTEFYSNARASSSCSDDSILTDTDTPERSILHHIHDDSVDFFSPDDSISLSLEYYNEYDNNDNEKVVRDKAVIENLNESSVQYSDSKSHLNSSLVAYNPYLVAHKRYLQCPAGVNVKHLTKFIRMKYGLSFQHRIDIIYEDEILPKYFTLMDVAYSYKWKRTSPMRFMYRIFESTKTPLLKFKQEPSKLEPLPTNFTGNTRPKPASNENYTQSSNTSHRQKSQSNKTVSSNTESIVPIRTHKPKTPEPESSGEKDQRDEEARLREKEREIQEFAKKRDLEWANLMRQSRSPTPPPSSPKVFDRINYPPVKNRVKDKPASPKKRKKSKHSKHSTSLSKRRKLHAEIQSPTNEQDDILKLKVKLTPTVHKVHKHKHSQNNPETSQKITPPEKANIEPPVKDVLSPKEKLLQMRQVRHKPISSSTPSSSSQELVNGQAKKVRFEITSKPSEKPEKQPEVKVNKCPQLVAPNSFTVEKVASGEKRKAESFELSGKPDPKIPSLEIMLINPTKSPDKIETSNLNRNSQNLVGNKNFPLKINNNNNNNTNNLNANSRLMAQNKMIMMRNLNLIQKTNPVKVQNGIGNGTSNQPKTLVNPPKSSPILTNNSTNGTKNQILSPIKKPSPPSNTTRASPSQSASTIPLSKIKKAGTKFSQVNSLSTPKSPPKTDTFGALDLSEKSTRISPIRLDSTSDLKSPTETKPKTLTNLHLLSDSAVHLRDLMVSAQNNNMGKNDSKPTGSNRPKSQSIPKTNGVTVPENKTVPKIRTPTPDRTTTKPVSSEPVKPLPNLTRPGTPSPKQNGQVIPKISDKLKLDPFLNSNPNSPQSKLNKILSTRLNFQPTSPNIPSLMKSISPITSPSSSIPSSTSNPSSQPTSSPPLLAPTSSSSTLPTIRIPILQNSKSLQAQMRSLQTMPKLQELSKISHFNSQIRATPNQAVRNIPNPSVVLARHAAVQNKPSTLLETNSSSSSLVEPTPKLIAESASS